MNNYKDLIYDYTYMYLQASRYCVDSHVFDGKILGSRSYGLKIEIKCNIKAVSLVLTDFAGRNYSFLLSVCLSLCLSAPLYLSTVCFFFMRLGINMQLNSSKMSNNISRLHFCSVWATYFQEHIFFQIPFFWNNF